LGQDRVVEISQQNHKKNKIEKNLLMYHQKIHLIFLLIGQAIASWQSNFRGGNMDRQHSLYLTTP
jgi:hypothetical protein